MELKPQTVLQGGRYVILGVLGRGGFGVTYLAEQVMAKRKVCIKEFFPKDYYTRDDDTRSLTLASQGFAVSMNRYKEKFVKEAQTIAALDHANIIPIYDVFEENNTAYYVMEYIDGESLSEVVKRRGALAESEAVEYVRQAASALEYLHERKIMHLDIKPGNMMLRRKDNRVVLIDFGLSKHYDEQSGEATSTTPVGVSHGFAPMEQYQQGGVSTFSPETDIYSLGATLYFILTGQRPPEAATLICEPLEFPQYVSATLRSAIAAAMALSPKQRPASVGKFVAMFGGVGMSENTIIIDKPEKVVEQKPVEQKPAPKPHIEEKPKPQSTIEEKPKSQKGKWWLWCLLVLAIIAGVNYISDNAYSDDAFVPDDTPSSDHIDIKPVSIPQLSLTSQSSMSFDHNTSRGTISYSLTDTNDVPLVTSNKSWITINSVGKSGTITFDVAANSGNESRSANIKVEYKDQSFNVVITQSGKPIKTYKIGDYYNENGKRGIVFQVWDGGRHGKIVSLDETGTSWLSADSPDIKTYAASDSDGKANTDKLMSRSDSNNHYAAKWCRDKGVSWYLPAKDELMAIFRIKDNINSTLGSTNLQPSYYWSSTEDNELRAWYVRMNDGYTNNGNKSSFNFVRAVSTF